MPLRQVESLEQLRASFQIKLPTSHFAKFTGGWLVLPEHTAAHGKLLELLRQRSVVLGSAQVDPIPDPNPNPIPDPNPNPNPSPNPSPKRTGCSRVPRPPRPRRRCRRWQRVRSG